MTLMQHALHLHVCIRMSCMSALTCTYLDIPRVMQLKKSCTNVMHFPSIFRWYWILIFVLSSEGPIGLETVPVAVVLQGQNNLTYLCESCSSDTTQCETDDSVWPGKEIYLYLRKVLACTAWTSNIYMHVLALSCAMVLQGVSQGMVCQPGW